MALEAIVDMSKILPGDAIAPLQYDYNWKKSLSPEKRLILAVLEDAVYLFQKHLGAADGRGKDLFREAEEWILEKNSDRIFSFESTCEALGYNPEYVRGGIMRAKKQYMRYHQRTYKKLKFYLTK